jgi:hypothetical protein
MERVLPALAWPDHLAGFQPKKKTPCFIPEFTKLFLNSGKNFGLMAY